MHRLVLATALLLPGIAAAHHPHDPVTALAVSPDFANDHTVVCASPGEMNVLLISRDGGLTWEAFHRGLRGHIYSDLAFAPDWNRSGTLYLGTRDGGFQASRDRGQTWDRPPSGLDGGVDHIAVGPLDAGGSHVLFASRSGGVLHRSDDGGRTFRRIRLPIGSAEIDALEISPTFNTDHTVVAAGSDSRVHWSRDGGTNWSTFSVPAPVRDIELSHGFATDSIGWLATWGAGVLVAQLPNGTPLMYPAIGLSDRYINDIDIVPPAVPGRMSPIMYAATKDAGVVVSVNAGNSWLTAPLSIDKTAQTSNHFRLLRVSPTWRTDRSLFCGCFEGLYVGHEFGTRWLEANINPTHIGQQLAMSPSFAADGMVAACGYGQSILVSSDHGASFDARGIGYGAGDSYELSMSPLFSQDRLLLTGVFRGIRRTTDGGQTWSQVDLPSFPDQHNTTSYSINDIAFSPNYASDGTIYALSSAGVVYRSTDRSNHWSRTNNTILPAGYSHTLVLSPRFAADSTVFAAGRGLFLSTDGGTTFRQVMDRYLVEDSLFVPSDFQSTGTCYALANGLGFLSIDLARGTVTVSDAGLDGYWPRMLRPSPDFNSDSTLFVTTSGGPVYRSIDRGATWAPIGSARDLVANARTLEISPNFATDSTMMAGVYGGQARSTDGGMTWQLVSAYEAYDDNRDPWQKLGSWRRENRPDGVRFGVTRSKTVGDRMRLPFQGIGVRIQFAVGPDRGKSLVEIDGFPIAIVDCYAASPSGSATRFIQQNLSPGLHVLDIVVLGARDSRSSEDWVSVDQAEVISR